MKIEVHSHTIVSDGALTPEKLVMLAANKGLYGIAVTDHNTFRGSILAKRASRIHKSDMLIIYGNEVRSEWGDILVLCGEPVLGEPPKDPFELKEWALDNNCITIAAHPYHFWRVGVGLKLRKHPEVFDAVEVWNPRGIPVLNLPAMIDASKLRKPAVSGSDAHVAREVGTAPVIIDEPVEDAVDVIEAILKGRVRPTIALPSPLAYVEMASWAIARRLS